MSCGRSATCSPSSVACSPRQSLNLCLWRDSPPCPRIHRHLHHLGPPEREHFALPPTRDATHTLFASCTARVILCMHFRLWSGHMNALFVLLSQNLSEFKIERGVLLAHNLPLQPQHQAPLARILLAGFIWRDSHKSWSGDSVIRVIWPNFTDLWNESFFSVSVLFSIATYQISRNFQTTNSIFPELTQPSHCRRVLFGNFN